MDQFVKQRKIITTEEIITKLSQKSQELIIGGVQREILSTESIK
jgi:hypothetical protein